VDEWIGKRTFKTVCVLYAETNRHSIVGLLTER